MADETTPLSEREREILKLVATGATNQQIAGDLGISVNTVKVHLRNIFGKIGAASRTEATLFAVRAGLVEVTKAAMAPVETPPAPPPPYMPSVAPATPADQRPASFWARHAVAMIGSAGGLVIAGVLIWLLGFRPQVAAPPTPTPATAIQAPAQPGTTASWVAQRDLPIAVAGAAATSVDGRVYLIGGRSGESVSKRIWRYDPASSAWAALPDKPTPVHGIQAVALGGQIYVPGGEQADGTITDVLEVYDPASQTWTARTKLPAPRTGYGLAAVDGRFYLFGGWDGSQERAETFVYDPASDAWRALEPMPTTRAYGVAVAVDGKIYMLGGEAQGTPLSANEQFTPSIDGPGAWAKMTPLEVPRSRFGASALSNNIVVMGGSTDAPPARYDVRSTAWETLKPPALPIGAQPAVATRDSSVFVVVGDPTKAAGVFYELRLLFTVTITLP